MADDGQLDLFRYTYYMSKFRGNVPLIYGSVMQPEFIRPVAVSSRHHVGDLTAVSRAWPCDGGPIQA